MHHICHITTTFNQRSGSARRTRAILEACRDQGYRVSLIVGRSHDIVQDVLPGISLHVAPALSKRIDPRQDVKALWALFTLLQTLQPDLVHTHLAKAGILGRLAARLAGIPLVMHTVHGPTFPARFPAVKRTLFRTMERFCGLWTDHFVFVGCELQENYIAAKVCSRENSTVVYTGRPDGLFNRIPLRVDQRQTLRLALCDGRSPRFLVVAVGRIVPAKQFEHAIEILASVRQAGIDAHLAIIGKALLSEELAYERKVRACAERKGIKDHVHFCGYRDDILDVMEAADAILLTSQYEGLPNVAVEAVIAGTPMVSYHVSGVREVLTSDRQGWVVAQGDAAGAAALLTDIAQGRQISENVDANAGRSFMLDQFRQSEMVRNKLRMYGELLHQKAGTEVE